MKIPIADIIIRERQRVDLGNLSDLDSMAEPNIGQIQPIGVNDKHELIWGMRRYSWAKAHGWTEIEAIVRTGLTPIDEQLIELYEDTKRKDRTWQERCVAAAKIHGMKVLEAGANGENWTTRELAAFTGITHTTVTYLLRLAAEINENPEGPVAKAENYFAGVKIMMQQQKDKVQAELERRRLANAVTPTIAKHEAEQYSFVGTEVSRSTGGENIQSLPKEDTRFVGDEEIPFPEPVQDLNKSVSAPKPTVIQLQGHNADFTLTAFDHTYKLILAAFPEEVSIIAKLRTVLADNGIAVIWLRHASRVGEWVAEVENAGLQVMPWPLVWNITNDNLNYHWPFIPYAAGLIVCKGRPVKVANPFSSIISAPQEVANRLPLEVVNFTLDALSLDGDTVLLACNSPATETAVCGRIPVFFEANEVKYTSLCEELALHYESVIPNVIIKMS